MKKLTTFFFLLIAIMTWGQEATVTTNGFIVTGQVKKELKFSLADLEKYPAVPIGDVIITNHVGEPRGTVKQLKGILVKDLLKEMEMKEESPKRFSEFYLVFIAIDNYKVVFSWNEIFNSPTGDNLFLITTKDGEKIGNMGERILILVPTDYKTGRRHIKGLNKILVERIK